MSLFNKNEMEKKERRETLYLIIGAISGILPGLVIAYVFDSMTPELDLLPYCGLTACTFGSVGYTVFATLKLIDPLSDAKKK